MRYSTDTGLKNFPTTRRMALVDSRSVLSCLTMATSTMISSYVYLSPSPQPAIQIPGSYIHKVKQTNNAFGFIVGTGEQFLEQIKTIKNNKMDEFLSTRPHARYFQGN